MCPLYALVISSVIGMWNIDLGVTGFGYFMLMVLFGLISSFVMALLISVLSPLAKNQNEIMVELEKNGYSERFIQLAEQEINRLISTGKAYQNYRYFCNYVRIQADAYLYCDDVNSAINGIGRINLRDMQTYLKKLDHRAFLEYFDIQMMISEELKDAARADAVMNDAAVYFPKEIGKDAVADIIVSEIQSTYYLIAGDLANAYECAQKCFTFKGHPAYEYVGYALCAKVHIAGGRLADAADCIAKMEAISKKSYQKQGAAYLRRKLSIAQNAFYAGQQA